MSSPLAIQTLPFAAPANAEVSTQPVADLAANDPFIQPDPIRSGASTICA